MNERAFRTPAARRNHAELTLALAEIAADDRYSFTYPHLPERYAGLAEKFPGLPLLVVTRSGA